MFKLLSDAIENAMDVAEDFVDGNLSKEKVAKLIADGISIAAIAVMFDVSVDAIESIIDDE